MAVEQPLKNPIDEHLKMDEFSLPQVVTQQAIPAMSVSSVLVTCNGADIACVDTQSKPDRGRLLLVPRGTSKAIPHEPFSVCVSSFAEKERKRERVMHLPYSMFVARGRHIAAWATTADEEWAHDKTGNNISQYLNTSSRRIKLKMMINTRRGSSCYFILWKRLPRCGMDLIEE